MSTVAEEGASSESEKNNSDVKILFYLSFMGVQFYISGVTL